SVATPPAAIAQATKAPTAKAPPAKTQGPKPTTPGAQQKSYDESRVGDADPQRIIVPTNQVLSPIGRQVEYTGRPTDLTLSPDGRWLAVLDFQQVLIIDPVAGKIVSRARHPDGSYAGLAFTPDGRRLYA